MANTFIIDGNSIAHQHHNATRLSVGNFEVQAIFGFIRSLHAVAKEYPGWNILVLWDGRAQHRVELFPEYKANRDASLLDAKAVAHRDSLRKQSPYIKKGIELLGINQVRSPILEADDLGGYFAKRLSDQGNDVVVGTGDQDWIQLVGPRVKWYDPIRERFITHQDFFEKTGYMTPEAFLQGKALLGDNSDGINGVPKIGKKKAPEILAEFGSVENFFEQVDSGAFTPKYVIHKNLASEEGREIFRRNVTLMDLRNVVLAPEAKPEVTPAKFSKDNFQFFCEKLAFRSILRDLDGFLEPFHKAA